MTTKKQNKKMLDVIEGKKKSCDIVNIGFVGVDSGQILICDPCYIGSEWENEDFAMPIQIEVSTGKELKISSWQDEYQKGMTFNQARDKGLIREEYAKTKNNFSYNACCQKTLDLGYGQLNYKLGHAGVGVVSTTGWGDGSYPVYAKIDKKTGRVKELKVVFF